MTNSEIEFVTRLIGKLVDKTLKSGEGGDNVFNLVVAALNRVLKLAQKDGLSSKYEVMELCTRAWLAWYDYEKENNAEMLNSLKDIASQIMVLCSSSKA